MDASSISNRLNKDDGSLLGAYGKRLSGSITLFTVFKKEWNRNSFILKSY